MFDRSARAAFIVACITLGVSGLGFQYAVSALNIYLRKLPVPLREPFAKTIPHVLGEWSAVGEDQILDAATVENLGTDKYLDRAYARFGNPSNGLIHLHIAYYTGMIDTLPHIPDRCFTAAGLNAESDAANYDLAIDTSAWPVNTSIINKATGLPYQTATIVDRVTNEVEQVLMPIGEYGIRATEFSMPNDTETRIFAGYLFVANGRTTATPTAVRLLAFDRTDKYAYYAKLQFSMTLQRTQGLGEFRASVASLLQELLPHVMRCLPDWSEVERQGDDPARATPPEAAGAALPHRRQPALHAS